MTKNVARAMRKKKMWFLSESVNRNGLKEEKNKKIGTERDKSEAKMKLFEKERKETKLKTVGNSYMVQWLGESTKKRLTKC